MEETGLRNEEERVPEESKAEPIPEMSVGDVASMLENAVSRSFADLSGTFGLVRVFGRFRRKDGRIYGNGKYGAIESVENHNGKTRELTAVFPSSVEERLEEGKSYLFQGAVSFRKAASGSVSVNPTFEVGGVVSEDRPRDEVDAEEKARCEAREKVLRERLKSPFRTLRDVVLARVLSGRELRVKCVIGHSAVVDKDVLASAGSASLPYPCSFEFVRSSMSDARALSKSITDAAAYGEPDCIAVVRGGGDMEGVFDSPGLAATAASCKTPVYCALGHAVDSPFFERVVDGAFTTPTEFGAELRAAVSAAVAKRDGESAELRIANENKLAAMREEMEKKAEESGKRFLEAVERMEKEKTEVLRRTLDLERRIAGMEKEMRETDAEIAKMCMERAATEISLNDARKKAENALRDMERERAKSMRNVCIGIVVGAAVGMFVASYILKMF